MHASWDARKHSYNDAGRGQQGKDKTPIELEAEPTMEGLRQAHRARIDAIN